MPLRVAQEVQALSRCDVKAITLTQPWATLMALGAKRVETRSWKPHAWLIGQAVAIHAGAGLGGLKRSPDERVGKAELEDRYVALCSREPFLSTLSSFYSESGEEIAARLPRGAIVAEGILSNVASTEAIARRLAVLRTRELAFGNYAAGRWGWGFQVLTAVGPIPVRGMQGLWDVPEEIAQALAERALAEGRYHL